MKARFLSIVILFQIFLLSISGLCFSQEGRLSIDEVISFTEIDSMGNSVSMANPAINPLLFDERSGIVAVVHNGIGESYTTDDGELWWNYSTDMGGTWLRSQTSVQYGLTATNKAVYPSASLFNPTQSTILQDLYGVFSWSETTGISNESFSVGWGVTLGFEESALAELADDTIRYSPGAPIFSDDDWIFWLATEEATGSVKLFRTQDYGTIEQSYPEQWRGEIFGGEVIILGVDAYEDSLACGFFSPYPDAVGEEGWKAGVSYSTDHGVTWSDIKIIQHEEIPLVSDYEGLWDWDRSNDIPEYSGDLVFDYQGKLHLAAGLSKKMDNKYSNSIVEFIDNGDSWDAVMIVEGLDDNSLYRGPDTLVNGKILPSDPGQGKFGYGINLASYCPNGYSDFFIGAKWHYHGDYNNYCDIFYSVRFLVHSAWEQPINVTDTRYKNETGAFMGKRMYWENDYYFFDRAFILHWYEKYSILNINPLNKASLYVQRISGYPYFQKKQIWLTELIVSEVPTAETIKKLYLGLSDEATAGIDPALGEKCSPEPLAGEFDAAFLIPGNPKLPSLIDVRYKGVYSSTWEVNLKPGEAGYPFLLKWTPMNCYWGNFTMKYSENGSNVFVDMQTDSTCVISDSTVTKIEIFYFQGTTGSLEDISNTPEEFQLEQNYPNPFNPSTKISFTLPEEAITELKVYNILGEEIALLANGEMKEGKHEVTFNASKLCSGIYFYSLKAGTYSATKKMLLLR